MSNEIQVHNGAMLVKVRVVRDRASFQNEGNGEECPLWNNRRPVPAGDLGGLPRSPGPIPA